MKVEKNYVYMKGIIAKMNIYPKIDERLTGLEALKEYIEISNGIEIQFFHNDGIWENYNIVPVIENLMQLMPNLKEITIHTPLENYDIELIALKDIELIKTKIKDTISLSNKYNIKINLLYHVTWPIEMMEQGAIEKIEELVQMLKNTNVNLLIENLYAIEEHNHKCTVLEICKRIDNEHLKVCLDICHIHCMANIFKLNFDEYLSEYIDRNLAEKYIYQIHFSATKDNDGFIKKGTHGRKHDSLTELMEDYKILQDYNITNTNIITEISEEDYSSRKDQIYEIELLKNIKEQ